MIGIGAARDDGADVDRGRYFLALGLDDELAMLAVGARLAGLVEEHMRGRGDDVVGQRELPGAARVAAADDAGGRVLAADRAGVEMMVGGEFLGGFASVDAEHHDPLDRQGAPGQRADAQGL